MENHTYWHKQTPEAPLWPDISWSKPEQRALSGRLGIVGGSRQGFIAAAESYNQALKTGVGEARVLLPDVLKKSVPAGLTEVVFGPGNPSGGLGQAAAPELAALAGWAGGLLLIGDAGGNSETAVLYEKFLADYDGQLTISRDAIDLLRNSAATLVERPQTLIVASFAQLQKLFRAVYYPKILTFSLQLAQAVEALHKFTITYPLTLATLHQDHLIVAHGGEVATTPWHEPMAIWRGSVATRAAVYWLWNPSRPLEAVSASLLDNALK